jgi:hypothetical protein
MNKLKIKLVINMRVKKKLMFNKIHSVQMN